MRNIQSTLQWLWRRCLVYHVLILSDPTAILGETRTEKCFALSSKMPFITDRLQPNLHFLQIMGREYYVVLLTDLTAILGEIPKKNFRPPGWSALHYCPPARYLALLVVHPQGVPCGITQWPHCNITEDKTKKSFDLNSKIPLICFDLKSKVPFITDRLQPNLHCFLRMRWEYHVVLLRDPIGILGEIERNTVSVSRIYCPTLPNDFNQTCTAFGAC
jgi:hypothetical protein